VEEVYDAVVMVISYQRLALFLDSEKHCINKINLCVLVLSLLPTSSWTGIPGLRAGRSGDQIPVGGEIIRTRPDWPSGQPSLLYKGYRLFAGGKAAEAWC
jgi:hypothetical protein